MCVRGGADGVRVKSPTRKLQDYFFLDNLLLFPVASQLLKIIGRNKKDPATRGGVV